MVFIALVAAFVTVLILGIVVDRLPDWYERSQQPPPPRYRYANPTGQSSSGLSGSSFGIGSVFSDDDALSSSSMSSMSSESSPLSSDSPTSLFDHATHHHDDDWNRVNPATGLPMVGSIDVGGNPYGMSDMSSSFDNDWHHGSAFDDHWSSGSSFDDRW